MYTLDCITTLFCILPSVGVLQSKPRLVESLKREELAKKVDSVRRDKSEGVEPISKGDPLRRVRLVSVQGVEPMKGEQSEEGLEVFLS